MHTSDPAPSTASTSAHQQSGTTTLTVLGFTLLALPTLHLLLVPLGIMNITGAREWAEATYDPLSLNVLTAIVLLTPGYLCLLVALRREPSRTRLIGAALAPSLVLLYAIAAITYTLLTL